MRPCVRLQRSQARPQALGRRQKRRSDTVARRAGGAGGSRWRLHSAPWAAGARLRCTNVCYARACSRCSSDVRSNRGRQLEIVSIAAARVPALADRRRQDDQAFCYAFPGKAAARERCAGISPLHAASMTRWARALQDLPKPPPGQRNLPTLVIGLEDVLVTQQWDVRVASGDGFAGAIADDAPAQRRFGWRTVKRPGVDDFLAHMSQVRAAALPDHAPPLS